MYTNTPSFFGFPSHVGDHRALSRVYCHIQSVLISYVYYTQQNIYLGFSGGSVIICLPMQEVQFQSLLREIGPHMSCSQKTKNIKNRNIDSLEKEMATHPSILSWKMPWTEESGGLQSRGRKRVGRDSATKQHVNPNLPIQFYPSSSFGIHMNVLYIWSINFLKE